MDFNSFVLAAATADLEDAGTAVAREHADAIEFRMDLAEDPLTALRTYDGGLPLIATNRARREGGEASAPGRLDVLCEAAEHQAVEAVDVELAAVEHGEGGAVIERASAHNATAVVSVHDFGGTPPRAELEDGLGRAAEVGDVGKLSVTAECPDDVLALLGATRARTAVGDQVATMAMGAAGRHSRAIAPLYGSRIGYAPVDPADATAPGQYDLATLAKLIARLR